jgi:hypothetical protein
MISKSGAAREETILAVRAVRPQLDTTAIIARRNRSAGVLAGEFGRRPAA